MPNNAASLSEPFESIFSVAFDKFILVARIDEDQIVATLTCFMVR